MKCVLQISKSYTFKKSCLEIESVLRKKLGKTEDADKIHIKDYGEIEMLSENINQPYQDIKLIFINENEQLSTIEENEIEPAMEDEEYISDTLQEDTHEFKYTIKSNDGNAIQVSIMDNNEIRTESEEYEIVEQTSINNNKSNCDSEYEEYDELKASDDYEYDGDHMKMEILQIQETGVEENDETIIEDNIEDESQDNAIINQNQEETVGTSNTKTKSKGKISCKICNRILSNKNSLNYHMQLHSNSASFQCNICGEKFKTRNAYTGHMTIHQPENQHKCQFCDKVYRQAASLKNHMLVHTGEKPFICAICGKGSTQKSGFKVLL